MTYYSIKDLEQLTGIKAGTIRIWEQRYKIVTPRRTATNIRYYTGNDLKKLLNVALLNQNGWKISAIAKMDDKQLHSEALDIADKDIESANQVNMLTLSMVDMDEARFDKVISHSVLRTGFRDTMIKVIYPFLEKIGIMWMVGSINPAQEHFISNLIRQKLISAIDAQHVELDGSSLTFLLFCPAKEDHELGLLFSNYLLRANQHKTVYLGANVPFENLKFVFDLHQPDYILASMITYPVDSELQDYIDRLAKDFNDTQILLAGRKVIEADIQLPANVRILEDIHQLEEIASNGRQSQSQAG